MKKFMHYFKYAAALIVGLTFMFSGFVKGIDPWGFSYKLIDYFHVMGLNWLVWSAFPLSILIVFAEFAMGVSLFFNIRVKFVSWLVLIFMVYFFFLTLWIAIANPVTDCGCFGDALVISNWATFYKNVVLIFLTIIVFIYRKDFKPYKIAVVSNTLGGIFIAGYLFAVYYSYNHEPVIDFRPYKVGVNIPEAMAMPADAPTDVYENTFFYKNKNTGKVERFKESNYPWQDTLNWEFSKMDSKLIKQGYKPPIHDFSMVARSGEEVTDYFIHDENYVFILVAYNLSKTNRKAMDRINKLAAWAGEKSYPFVGLTSSGFEDSDEFRSATAANFEFFTCDEITLKTIIRSNPGLIALKGGTIIGKWHFNDIPDPEEMEAEFMNK